MRRLLLILALLMLGAPAAAEQEILETVTLQPQETKEVAVAADARVKIGWDYTDESVTKGCKNECVKMARPDGAEMASSMGGAMGILPIDGKVTATFQNVEDFPIGIAIYRE